MAISVQKAELIGAFLETLCYGVYLMIVFETVDILRKKSSRRFGGIYLYVSALAMFIAITLHEVIDIIRVMQAFTEDESNPKHANQYYNELESSISVFKTVIYTVVTIISDAFIVYRTYVVWNRSLLIALGPTVILIGDTAMGITADYELTRLKIGSDTFTAHALSQRTQAFYALTVSLNVICTLLIAYKIWSIQRETASISTMSSAGASLTRVVNILIESCAVYSAFLFVLIGTYAAGSPAMFIILDMTAPVIGIVFFSVINRVGRGVSHGDHTTGTGTGRKFTTLNFAPRSMVNPSTGITVETSTELHDLDSFQLGVQMRPDGTVVSEKTSMTSFTSKQRSLPGAGAV